MTQTMYVLLGVATVLTYGMFQNRQSLLGFPSSIFWSLAGAVAYQSSTATWDVYFLLAIGCLMGMNALVIYGAHSFVKGSKAESDEAAEFDEEEYFDEDSQTTQKRKVKRKKKESDEKEDKKKTDEMFEIGGEKRERDDVDGIDAEPKAGRKGKKSVWGSFR